MNDPDKPHGLSVSDVVRYIIVAVIVGGLVLAGLVWLLLGTGLIAMPGV
jgi:hypothetical protein